MSDIDTIQQLQKKNTDLNLEIIDLARQLAAAENRAEQRYDSGFQHGQAAAGEAVSHLPKTVDGVPMFPGMTVWLPPEKGSPDSPTKVRVLTVSAHGIEGKSAAFECGAEARECYSTKTAAAAAASTEHAA